MKKLPAITALALALISGLAQADRLEDIRKAGVLRVASFDSNPPFGFVDAKSKQIEGLDVDYAKALADKLGVRLQVLPTNPANRIPLLTANKVDLVLANFTITPERAQQVDFSIPYFSSGQQFIVKKGTLTSPEVLNKWRVGVDKGTVNEGVLREKFPGAKVIAYDDTPFAFTALRNGQVQAITQDGPKLIGLLANVPDRDKYEVPPFTISNDLIGVGIPKGEKALTEFVDKSLRELEQDGQAQKIYDTWFGPQTKTRWRACTRSATRAERPASPARPARLTSLRRVFRSTRRNPAHVRRTSRPAVPALVARRLPADPRSCPAQLPARHPDRRPLAIARLSRRRLLSWPARAYLALFRNTPLLVQLFFWYFGVPALLPEALVSWLNTPHETPLLDWPSFEFLAGAWGLTLYTSAFVAEEFRAGIASVRPEQRAAGLALGLTQRQVWREVVLPQALRTALPPLLGQYMNALKNSSLAMAIGLAELSYASRQVETETFKTFQAFGIATLLYIGAIALIEAFGQALQQTRRYRQGGA